MNKLDLAIKEILQFIQYEIDTGEQTSMKTRKLLQVKQAVLDCNLSVSSDSQKENIIFNVVVFIHTNIYKHIFSSLTFFVHTVFKTFYIRDEHGLFVEVI